jgi:hypothetical protein
MYLSVLHDRYIFVTIALIYPLITATLTVTPSRYICHRFSLLVFLQGQQLTP